MKSSLFLLLLLALLTGRPAAAQGPVTSAADTLTERVDNHSHYLADALQLSQQQRQQVAALLTQQLTQPARPVPTTAWLQVLTLHQYQLWQLMNKPLEIDDLQMTKAPSYGGPLLAGLPE